MKIHRLYTAALSMAICSTLGSAALAETRLEAKDGSFVLQGTMVNVDSENYTLRTDLGEMVVRRGSVNCSGDFCAKEQAEDAPAPAAAPQVPSFALIGPGAGGELLLNEVVKGYTGRQGLQITESFGNDGIHLLLGDNDGQLVADVKVAGKSTKSAVQDLLEGSAAFAVTVFPATPEMLTEITGREIKDVSEVLHERIVGIDALVVVTHPSNPVKSMTTDQVAKVLAGEITNWAELGGVDMPITLHLGAESMELNELTRTKFLDGKTQSPNARLYPTTVALKSALSADPSGFSTYYRSFARGLQQVELISDCKIHYGSSNFAIQANEYPFFINVYSYLAKDGDQVSMASDLLANVVTNEGQSLMTRIGLVPQVIQTERAKDQGERLLSSVISTPNSRAYNTALHKYLDAASEGTRLSTALRFVTGSSEPDLRAKQDIARISDYIQKSASLGQKFTVVGFSDSVGGFDQNVMLSEGRARAIKAELLARNEGVLQSSDIEVLGVGPIAPVDCNDTERGRELNRRVEIWVSPKN